ncbi:MAG: universal stress protein [Candidatus Methylomirabilales bacterium]
MIAIKTILLPTDGSEGSGTALAYALFLAKELRARVVGLHVIDQRWEDQTRRTFGEVRRDVLQAAQARHEAETRGIMEAVAEAGTQVGLTVETRLVTGSPVEQIVREATALPADLIIMGTHGRTGISHVFLGSVAEKVIRRAPCPVLTVRPKGHDVVAP